MEIILKKISLIYRGFDDLRINEITQYTRFLCDFTGMKVAAIAEKNITR